MCTHIWWRRKREGFCLRRITALLFNSVFPQTGRGDCQGHKPSVSHLSRKFKTSYMTCRTACSTQPRRDHYITCICLQSLQAFRNTILHSGSSFLLYCTTVCIHSKPLGLSPSAIHPANEVFMTQDFAFWYVTPILFNSPQAGVSAVMSKFKK